MKNTTETRTFKPAKNMIFHVIYNQAGSVEKAILECLMNAVDAGATKVEVDFNDNGIDYSVKDNGKGFSSKKEIEDCFEVFGFDHGTPEENHRTYGTFGIGRAQLWAFSKNQWKTNNFILSVDIKNQGLDYVLTESKEKVKGCHIVGQFYDKQSLADLQRITRELVKLALYLPIEFVLDGKVVNKKNKDIKWDYENDKAYVKFNDTGDLKIYNQGVFVRSYSNYHFGKGGTINSKVALALNTARNDILLSKCEVWKSIRKFVEEKSTKETLKKEVLTPDQCKNMFLKWMSGECLYKDISDKKIFPDAKGKLCSLDYTFRFTNITVSPQRGSLVGESIQAKKLAFVFSPDVLDWADQTASEFATTIQNCLDRDRTYKKLTFLEFSNLQPSVGGKFDLVEEKQMSKKEKLYLDVIELINTRVANLVRYHRYDSFSGKENMINERKVRIGVTDLGTASWTDGVSYLAFNKTFVADHMDKGLGGMLKIINYTIHEYLHTEQTSEAHVHSFEFYEQYHDLMNEKARDICQIQKEASQRLAYLFKKNNFSIPRAYVREDGISDEAG